MFFSLIEVLIKEYFQYLLTQYTKTFTINKVHFKIKAVDNNFYILNYKTQQALSWYYYDDLKIFDIYMIRPKKQTIMFLKKHYNDFKYRDDVLHIKEFPKYLNEFFKNTPENELKSQLHEVYLDFI